MRRGLSKRNEGLTASNAKSRRAGNSRASQAAAGGVREARHPSLQAILRAVAGLVILGTVVFGAVHLYRSSLFAVSKVEVLNARLVDSELVARTSGLTGENILGLDTDSARARILQLPLVRQVEIRRQFPRTVLIDVQEREPWGYWESGGGRYVIDRDGLVLNRGLPVEGAPLVMQLDGGQLLRAGNSVDTDALHLTRTLQERLPEAVSGGRLPAVAFEFREKDGLTVTLKSGLRVTFGDSNDLDYKLAALRALLQRAPEATYVDLRFGDRVVFQGNMRP